MILKTMRLNEITSEKSVCKENKITENKIRGATSFNLYGERVVWIITLLSLFWDSRTDPINIVEMVASSSLIKWYPSPLLHKACV